MSTEESIGSGTAQSLRPSTVEGKSATEIARWLNEHGFATELVREGTTIGGITMDSREVQPGDLYVALPGAKSHGAQFADRAVSAGAAALLTDRAGVDLAGDLPGEVGLLVSENLRELVGPLSAVIYNSQPQDGSAPTLFAVTGTNGKTTTTYMINSIMQKLGHATGLIGTIEILAGSQPIPSKLTTPESPHVHSLISLMSERGISSMAMEVSSHALDYHRVDGVRYDVSGFTNLTQDHLDLHGTMESYCDSKAALFTPEKSRRAVICADDSWGQTMLGRAREAMGAENVVALTTHFGRGLQELPADLGRQDWVLTEVEREGIGHRFTVVRGDGARIESSTQLPADFNVSNAALAAVMVYESGQNTADLAARLAEAETLTPVVPGRMQLIGTAPTAIVDFAHNPDALQRALEAIDPAHEDGRVMIVFGATGERDQLKRPIMGEIAAHHADVVIITDDDPHDEAPEPIRAAVEAGARDAQKDGARAAEILNLAPRAAAIEKAIELAGPHDSILVAGRGHEVAQEVAGVNLDLDDRVEVARALAAHGFEVLPAYRSMLGDASA